MSAAGEVTTLAGLAGSSGSADGPGSAARFYEPQGVAVDSAGNLYVADTQNNTIRKGTLYPPQTLSLVKLGTGTISAYPTQTNYDYGQSVTLTATSGRWYSFLHWSDGVTNNPRSILIGLTNNYSAVFTNTTALELVDLTKQWEREFGGSNDDYLTALQATPDGGAILGGYSYSGLTGNKGTTNYGGADYWVIKVDATGEKQWERSFGGSADDLLQSIVVASDRSYVLAGYSSSGADGNKTTANYGLSDVWLIKLDANGNKVWDREHGGSGMDYVNTLIQTLISA